MSKLPTNAPSVVYAFPTSHRFRAPFHELLRQKLNAKGIQYDYVYSNDDRNLSKDDTIQIDWATPTPMREVKVGGSRLLVHNLGKLALKADLLILQQQNNLIANFYFQIFQLFRKQKIAFFGHGKNFQARNTNSLAERFKRFWATKVHWWFTYTDGCRKLIESYGFPEEKITVFNNSIDLTKIQNEVESVTPERLQLLRTAKVNGSENVAIYVGGLYSEKRIPFLLDSVHKIREILPDFHIVVIGSGPDASLIKEAAEKYDWIHYEGSQFGVTKTELVLLAKVWLMPGLVGLAVLDSFAYGTPMITTKQKFHSPEIDYLEDKKNGLILDKANDTNYYAITVVQLMTDENKRQELVLGAKQSLGLYSIESMAERFANGVEQALKTKK